MLNVRSISGDKHQSMANARSCYKGIHSVGRSAHPLCVCKDPAPDIREFGDGGYDALLTSQRKFVSRRRGVTLRLLWVEYREAHPDGLGYT